MTEIKKMTKWIIFILQAASTKGDGDLKVVLETAGFYRLEGRRAGKIVAEVGKVAGE